HAYFAIEGIDHQTSVARTPEQNGVVERRNRTLVEAARTIDGANLDKMKEKGDACIFVGWCQITSVLTPYHNVKEWHLNISLSPGPLYQENLPHTAETVTMSNELDLLFSLLFDELLNGSTQVVSKSSAETTADASNCGESF
nr:integrase, catalytic region, zinc finger, CCHC-type, peptidase aspartic, catalytic [Tanacetum cinerariifolium]